MLPRRPRTHVWYRPRPCNRSGPVIRRTAKHPPSRAPRVARPDSLKGAETRSARGRHALRGAQGVPPNASAKRKRGVSILTILRPKSPRAAGFSCCLGAARRINLEEAHAPRSENFHVALSGRFGVPCPG